MKAMSTSAIPSDAEFHELLSHLEANGPEHLLQRLAGVPTLKRDHVTAMRLGGCVETLVQLLEPATALSTLHDALELLWKAAEQDVCFKEAVMKAGAVRKLCRLLDGGHAEQVTLPCIRLLHQCINSGKIVRAPAIEEIFRLGAASKAARLLEGPDAAMAEAAGDLFWEVTDLSAFRERCRDLGLVPLVLGLLARSPDVPGYMGFVNNLSRSEALHLSLQEHGVMDVLEVVLEKATVEVNMAQALITVAHVFAGQDKHERSEALLARHDASLSVMAMLEACLHGDATFGGVWWALDEAVQAAQSLSQKERHAEKLYKVGCLSLLEEVLTQRGEDGDAVYQACRAIANLASTPSLKGRLQQNKGLIQSAQMHEASEDLRVQDAAKAALLQLGALKDRAVLAAESALTGDQRDYMQKYDVFLSHKRTDSKDFARALYNLLVVRSFKTFLDYEYREELSDLGQIVANSSNLIFIMTDNIFDSPWCLKELEAAVSANINIIFLVKEGSRWKNDEGLKVCEFPGSNILGKLPDHVQKVFSRKALYHSDEYYQTFVDMLVKKIIRQSEAQRPGGRQSDGGSVTTAATPLAPPSEGLHPYVPGMEGHRPSMLADAPYHAVPPWLQHQYMAMPLSLGRSSLLAPALPPACGGAAAVAELASLMQGELASLRRDLVASMQEVRRETANEVHQMKLDFAQQLHLLRRELAQQLSDLTQRLGEGSAAASAAPCGRGLAQEASHSSPGYPQQQQQAGGAVQRQLGAIADQLQRLTEQFQAVQAVEHLSTGSEHAHAAAPHPHATLGQPGSTLERLANGRRRGSGGPPPGVGPGSPAAGGSGSPSGGSFGSPSRMGLPLIQGSGFSAWQGGGARR